MLKTLPVKKLLTFIIGILVAVGLFQQSDSFIKVVKEVENVIPESVLVGDLLKDEEKTTTSTSLLVLDSDEKVSEKSGPYLVTKIADGDTVTVDIDGTLERVRLLGIDAAETSKTETIQSECYAEAAKNELTSLVNNAQYVYLEYDASQGLRDKYDRLLAYVYIKNTNVVDDTEAFILVNDYLLREGFVYEYTYNKPYKYQQLFQDSEVTAYDLEKGLWGVCR
jgi:micrococcal nuclease